MAHEVNRIQSSNNPYAVGGLGGRPENRPNKEDDKAKLFDLIMIITLQPLRQKISENSVLGGIYQKIKGLIYGRK